MAAAYLLKLPDNLRAEVKREARKHGITMNEYITTVLEQFIAIQRGKNGSVIENTERSGGG